MSRASKGRSIANFLELKPGEKIAATIRIQGKKTDEETWDEKKNIIFATKSGIVKKSNLSRFKNIRKGGIIAIQIEEGDKLIDGKLTEGDDEIVLITHEGMSIRFHEDELRDQGRDTVGVWGIRPDPGDYVVATRAGFERMHAARGGRERHRQADTVRRVPQAIARRKRHHHDEDRRQDRRRRGRPDRARERRDRCSSPTKAR